MRDGWVAGHPYPLSTEIEERRAEFDRMIFAVESAARTDHIAKVQAAIEAYGYTDYADGHEFRAIDCSAILEACNPDEVG